MHWKNKRLKINISGEIYETTERTIMRYPSTLLADRNKSKYFYCQSNNEYFFNRNKKCFDAILFFYQSYGRLSCPLDVNFDYFVNECRFFCLPEVNILKMIETEGLLLPNNKLKKSPDLTKWEKFRDRIWNILENPETSMAARIYISISLFVIIASVLSGWFEKASSDGSDKNHIENPNTLGDNPFEIIGFIANVFFSVEFLARLTFSPTLLSFFCSFTNWLDFVAIFPYFYLLYQHNQFGLKLQFLRSVRLIRIVRFFRISEKFKRLLIACEIIRSRIQDLQLVGACALITVILSGSLVYSFEKNTPNTKFTSIPAALWWAVQTTTTVGYGDIVPQTIAGKIIAGCFMAIGAVSASIPVLSIVTKFASLYSRNLRC